MKKKSIQKSVDILIKYGPLLLTIVSVLLDKYYDFSILIPILIIISTVWFLYWQWSSSNGDSILIRIKNWFTKLWTRVNSVKASAFSRITNYLALFMIVISTFCIYALAYPDEAKKKLLDNYYSGEFNFKSKFDQEAKDLEEWVRIPLKGIRFSQFQSSVELATHDKNSLESYLSNRKDRLLFITGNAGAGKTPIARQLGYSLYQDKFEKVFYVPLSKYRDEIKNDSSIDIFDLIAKRYKDVTSNTAYYNRVFQVQKTLLILDELDELVLADKNSKKDLIEKIIDKSNDLMSKYKDLQVIIFSRPEVLYTLDSYLRNDFPDYEALRVEPIIKNKDYLIDRWGDIFPSIDGNKRSKEFYSALAPTAKKLISESSVLNEISSELDYLNRIVEFSTELEDLNEIERINKLVEFRKLRNKASHWDRLGINAEERMNELKEIAYNTAARNNQLVDKTDSESDKMYLSGFIDIEEKSKDYYFSPNPIYNYFIIDYLAKNSGDFDKINELLLKALSTSTEIPDRVKEKVEYEFRSKPIAYLRWIDYISSIIGEKKLNSILRRNGISISAKNEILSIIEEGRKN